MARTARNADIPSLGALDRAAGDLSRQLAQALREAVRRGDVLPGDALPSTRLLATSLQVARGTVVDAYAQLIAEGFLESRGGAGTRVANALALAGPPPVDAPEPPARRHPPAHTGLPEPAATFARIAGEFRPLPAMPFAISVPIGLTAPDDIWRRLGNRLRARGAGAPSGYADPQGALPLREAIADYVRLLKPSGVVVNVGLPPAPYSISPGSLIGGNKAVAGSQIGGIAETQEMLDFCAENGIVSDIETIAMADIEAAYARMLRGDVKYRFVIDMATLK